MIMIYSQEVLALIALSPGQKSSFVRVYPVMDVVFDFLPVSYSPTPPTNPDRLFLSSSAVAEDAEVGVPPDA